MIVLGLGIFSLSRFAVHDRMVTAAVTAKPNAASMSGWHFAAAETRREHTMSITIDQLKTMSKEDMAALVLKLQSAPAKLTVKVNDKGTISIYGLQRFPVSLYPSQWERVFAAADQIKTMLPQAQKIVDIKNAAKQAA
jgi:hypothetical protein